MRINAIQITTASLIQTSADWKAMYIKLYTGVQTNNHTEFESVDSQSVIVPLVFVSAQTKKNEKKKILTKCAATRLGVWQEQLDESSVFAWNCRFNFSLDAKSRVLLSSVIKRKNQ